MMGREAGCLTKSLRSHTCRHYSKDRKPYSGKQQTEQRNQLMRAMQRQSQLALPRRLGEQWLASCFGRRIGRREKWTNVHVQWEQQDREEK